MYKLNDIAHETRNFWVLDVGHNGLEVMRKDITHSTRVMSVGHGPAPQLGITRAIYECDKRQAEFDAETDAI